MLLFAWIPLALAFVRPALAAVGSENTTTTISIYNDRLLVSINKANGAVNKLNFDNTSLLGVPSGSIGKWYFDVQGVPAVAPATSRYYEIGTSKVAKFEVVSGKDSKGFAWIGVIMTETVLRVNMVFKRYFFIKDGETGVHTFARITLPQAVDGVNYGQLGEFRTVFRPNTNLWTHLVTNSVQYGHLPSAAAIAKQVTVQDATWYLGNTPEDPYVSEQSDYFTKYEWAAQYGDHKAHGFYSEGSTIGLWTVYNNLEGYLGGPLRSDLVVDTNIYDYYVSNHRGASTPYLGTGYDRLFGPTFVYANKGGAMLDLLADAEKFATPDFDVEFYDSIAPYVEGFATSAQRGAFSAKIQLPKGAFDGKAILTQVGVDHQDSMDSTVGQYWANITTNGKVTIPRVKPGKYRLTCYASGVFGDYIYDNVVITAGKTTSRSWSWSPDQNGAEIWRIGVPDKSAGEYLHGLAKDPNHTNHPEEHRAYYGQWDFVNDFPTGVNYTVGVSDYAKDWNYIHYSRYGGTYTRKEYVLDNVNEWTINFELTAKQAVDLPSKIGTLTVQLAAARTPSGNLDVPEPSSNSSDLDLSVISNDNAPLVWTIPYYHSSSCSQRSGIECYNIANKYKIPGSQLKQGWNKLVLALPYNASGGDANFRQYSVDVMYDAIRLEVGKDS
ncbi:galactose mutarotase-like domain-containing protein [Mrakia frigida]|uniref:galactose mutarotase-like domain-containing protein n=1 Tax=Mrakia frigida TaxID=29902 RepID=UPI003FCC050A